MFGFLLVRFLGRGVGIRPQFHRCARHIYGIAPGCNLLDAQHQYEPVKAEIEWAQNIGIPLISGHDYGNPNPRFGVTRAVNETIGAEAIETVGMCWRGVGCRW